MELVVGAMNALLPKLAEMVAGEYQLHKGIKGRIMYLQRELESMQTTLENLSEVPADKLDKQVKLWGRDLRELSCEIEDIVDSYVVHVMDSNDSELDQQASRLLCCGSIKASIRKIKARRNITSDIERIVKEVREASERRARFDNGISTVAPDQLIDPRLPAFYEDVAKLVGTDRSREEVIKLLAMEGPNAQSRNLKLVAVVGPGGLGKTTLANLVYQKLLRQFDCGSFVSVSLKPNKKNVLSSILRDVSQGSYGNTEAWSAKEIIDKIRDVLKDKRYFIIVDDIWDESAWKYISCVFIENNRGGKIIVTTRNITVAEVCCSSDYIDGTIYQLQPLSTTESEKLFYYKIFHEDKCPPEFRDVAQKILKRCGGLPLAIVTIASLFANKQRQIQDQWYKIYNSIQTGHENSYSVKDMRRIFSLSYCDMPSQLKTCLMYLSIFPEDHIIEKDDLIWRWIAEGFVHPQKDISLYEMGETYFNELINRCMIQPMYVDTHGRTQACRVHDMVLDFIVSLATEENFVTILKEEHPSYPPNKIRRLSFQNTRDQPIISHETMSLSHVRSLTVFWNAVDFNLPLSGFLFLRVLDLEDCSSYNIVGLRSLVHLRYLRLSSTYFIELPKEIGHLSYLQTMDLKRARINELPSAVVQLRQLRRLYIDTRTKLPEGISNIRSLEELSEINITLYPDLIKKLSSLSKLRVLEISLSSTWDESYERPFLECLCNMKRLHTLYIFAPYVSLDFMLDSGVLQHLRRFMACTRRQTKHIFSLNTSYTSAELMPFSTLPSWINSSMCNLSELSIMVKKLSQEDLEILGGLSALYSLDLHVIETTRERLVISGTKDNDHGLSFRGLANFKFTSRAIALVFKGGAMQRLQMLSISFGIKETKYFHSDFDLGLENLISLKAVDVGIYCQGARLWEVQAIEDVVRHAINLNPSHPNLDLVRHFEREMVWDGMEEIPVLETMKVDMAGLAKIGPWGGNGGRPYDILVPPQRLKSMTICSGTVVDSIAFSYSDHNGRHHTAGPWGGHGGSNQTILLGASEFLTEVSGTVGPYSAPSNVITSLLLVTNAGTHGPFGKGGGIPFHTPRHSNPNIVGFFGRADWYVDAIGVYVNSEHKTIKEEKEESFTKFGLWGGSGGRPHDIKVSPHRLESVTICSDMVISSLAFSYTDLNGKQHNVGPWGGRGGTSHTIQFGPSEFLIEVSGTIGSFSEPSNVITSLAFSTNIGSRYGPFGQGDGTPFFTSMQNVGSIVGFFGRAGWHVDAIGVYMNPEQKQIGDEEEESGLTKAGLWGGNGGTPHDINVLPNRLESVTVCSGEIIDSLAFSYSDQNGHKYVAGPWGGHGGSSHTIQLGSSEFLLNVCGTIGPYAPSDVITSLTLVTTACKYGPFGQASGAPFCTPKQNNGNIVGLFGRATCYLDAIGVYVSSGQEATENDKKVEPKKVGPFGGNGGWNHDLKVAPHHLESITICSGMAINSLAFSYIDYNGQQHTVGPWGGRGGISHTIQLSPSEPLMEISGTISPFTESSDVIRSLTFLTNVGSYGPFGRGGGNPFHTPLQNNSNIVGFFGRAGWYLDAIGVYINHKRKATNKNKRAT